MRAHLASPLSPALRRALLAALVVVALPSAARAADEAPEPAPAAPAQETGWDAERFWFATLLDPEAAWSRLQRDLGRVPPGRRREATLERARAYVEAWGRSARPDELPPAQSLALARLHLAAEGPREALAVLRAMLAGPEVPLADQDAAMTSVAALLASPQAREALGEATVEDLAGEVAAYAAQRPGEDGAAVRGRLHQMLALHAAAAGDVEGELRHVVLAAFEDPAQAPAAGRSVVRALQGQAHGPEGYDGVRAGWAALRPLLERLAARHRDRMAAAGDARAQQVAERGLAVLAEAGAALDLLGRPAPAWTLEQAWGEVRSLEDLRGKVVVLDFWGTWCPWCVKSFPAVRDLLRDYAGQDLVVVGVTASASSVYEQRYDLDDDLAARAEGRRALPVAVIDRGGGARDDGVARLPEEEYRRLEPEVIGRFLTNHEVNWPIVMIDRAEPAARYAVTGWPQALVLDRHGRVRHLKSGALLRDRPEDVAAFRALLDGLLAEAGPAD